MELSSQFITAHEVIQNIHKMYSGRYVLVKWGKKSGFLAYVYKRWEKRA